MKGNNELPVKSYPKKKYKPSAYNHFFPVNDGHILAYNAFSNSLAKVTDKNFKIIKEILADPDHFNFNNEEDVKLKNDLIKGGYLIDSCMDEFEILKAQTRIGRFAGKTLSLTIAPTLSCFFKCTYCFENRKSDTMTREVEDALIKFVDKKLDSKKELESVWFGGEPLLKLNIIERLTGAFEKLCKKHNAKLKPASIITNGFLLTKEKAERLKKANITSAQVTLDGPPTVHDNRRKLANGGGTFQQIFDNIKKSAHILQIYVRINIDKENTDKLEKFYELWKTEGLVNIVPFYFGQVRADSKTCADISSQCFTTKEYSRSIIELLIKANKMGISNIRYPSLYKTGYCSADNLNAYVVAPSGHLFKCWEEISSDDEDSIGNLLDKENHYHIMNATRYINWDPFSNRDCKKCNIFPVCGGGCVYNGLNSLENKECNFWRYNHKEMLQLKYQEITIKNKGG